MKLFLRIVVMVAILSTNAWARMAEMMPVKAGTVEKYTSDNGKYEVSIMYGSNNFMSWSLAENGVQLWSRPLMCEPSPAAVSDNGETITLPIWGWRDECASKGVAVYNKKGELVLVKTDDKETKIKLCRIKNKSLVGDKIQLNLFDSRNILVYKNTDYKIGDTLAIEVPSQKILHHLKLERGAVVFISRGKKVGSIGRIDTLGSDGVTCKKENGDIIETKKEYAFVVGKDKPIIKLE